MSEVALQIGGRTYRVACAAGEEDRVTRLGATINDKLVSMGNPTGPDAQNLLFAALLLADEVQESRDATAGADEAVAAARRDADTALGQRDQLKATIASLEAELARLQSAAQSSAQEMEGVLSRQTELTEAIADHEAEAARLRAEIADLRSAPPPASGPSSEGSADLAALAPALERFAEMLEECADKLESRAASA
ncbi:Chromosome partition protein Smc [Tsuneonella dongtanensis]|uniref:Chromosome partition protein Smc n=1 Tax=Tsuneonella dongtanensis TaxID=692370 RepID=A0A1B2AEH6_9SPHN|nr:cell division protein ZapA [Tsuneonella dongtanensis]ANY20544.1 Chromosome partition protein Smc [Tsuneonella dongtanensis]